MRLIGLLAALAVGLATLVSGAQAATITQILNLKATVFNPDPFGAPVPFDPFEAKIQLTYDPTAIYIFEAGHATLISSSFPTFSDTILLLNIPGVLFSLGGSASGFDTPAPGTNDFILALAPDYFRYSSTTDSGHSFFTNTMQVTFTAATPIPGSLFLLLTALGGFAGFAVMRARHGGALGMSAA